MAVRNKKNYIIDLAQLIAWVGLLLSPALVDLTVTGKLPSFVRILKGTAFFVLPLFTLYALNYYCLVPSFLHKKGKARWFFLINAVILLAWNLVRFTRPVNFPQEVVDQFGQHIWAMYVGSILAAVFLQALVIAIAVGIRHIMRSNEQKMEAEEQQRKNTEAELVWLKNQLNPHFLFNTLNNISSLTQIDPEQAQDRIGQLSEALRYALYESNAEKVPLSGEVAFMENYIDLMALRCNEKTQVVRSFVLPDHEVMIAPLLFISLIENAFKHGVSTRVETVVRIDLHPEGADLCFVCENSLLEKTAEDRSGSGIGLANLKRRLELIYPGNYTYEQQASDGVYRAEVRLKNLL
jgi:two-component sensor histidine kinase